MGKYLSRFGSGTIVTERLTLRPLAAADAAALHATTDPTIVAAVAILRAPFTLSDAAALIGQNANGRDLFRGIFRLADGALAGLIGVHDSGTAGIEFGYWIGTLFQGKGYATEAARAVLIALDKAGAAGVFAECRPDNRASWRVLTKLGFRPNGEPGKRDGRVRLARPG
jgi:RimJ/RimL family protein N-acetyltransferase